MKPPPFTYHRPASVEEAAGLLAELGDSAKVLAGGQSLVPLLNFRLAAPEHLVDIGWIAGLDRIEVSADTVDVGAMVRDASLLDDPAVAAHPVLVEAAGWIAHPVIRNRGTVCGSLAHADPAAELPAVLALLGGSVEVVAWRDGAITRRWIAAADLFVGPLQTSLAPDELVVTASFPRLPAGSGWAVEELARRHGDFALAGVVLTVAVDGDGAPTAGRAAYLGCAPTPVVLDITPALDSVRAGTVVPTGADLASGVPTAPAPPARGARDGSVYDLVSSILDPTEDIHASGEYRRHLAAVLTIRALSRALDRAQPPARAEATIPRSGAGSSGRQPPARAGATIPRPGAGSMRGAGMTDGLHEVAVTVNEAVRTARVPARRLLSDFVRHDLGLTGTHVGCEHGVCGACTVLVDGEPVRSCLTFAVCIDGAEVTTVEGLGGPDGELGPVQQAFRECHGLQCGFCTPGFLLLTTELLARNPRPSAEEVADALGGNLCRCTGYVNIVRSVHRAAELVAGDHDQEATPP